MTPNRKADCFESCGDGCGILGSGCAYSDATGNGEGTSCGEGYISFSGPGGRGAGSTDLGSSGSGAGNLEGCGNGAGEGAGNGRKKEDLEAFNR